MNDTDIEMAELARMGNDTAAGICPACGDALNPLAPKWATTAWPKTRAKDGTMRETTAAEYAACVGPESVGCPGYHAWCIEGSEAGNDRMHA